MKRSDRARRAVLSALLVVVCGAGLAAQANPFYSPSDRETSDTGGAPSRPVPSVGPRAGGAWYRFLVTTQRRIQSFLSGVISAQRDSRDPVGLVVLICVSFAYGFLHALGPGHRKIVLSSYFLSERGTVAGGVATAFGIGLVHAGSAILMIFGLYTLVTGPVMNTFTSVSLDIERISYWMLGVIGVVMLITALVPTGGKKPEDGSSRDRRAVRAGSRLLFILASGVVPCPGAAAVLIFGIGSGAPGLGVVAAVSMSVGIGALLAVLVVATVLVKGLVGARSRRRGVAGGRFGAVAEPALGIAGALVIIGFSALMLLPA